MKTSLSIMIFFLVFSSTISVHLRNKNTIKRDNYKCSELKEKKCKEADKCSWDDKENECKTENSRMEDNDECSELKEKKCKEADKCSWDVKENECKTENSRIGDNDKCSELEEKNKCNVAYEGDKQCYWNNHTNTCKVKLSKRMRYKRLA